MLPLSVHVMPTTPALARMILLHGAGAPVQSDFFQSLQPALAAVGIETVAVNLSYMEQVRQGFKRPPPAVSALYAEFVTIVPLLLAQLRQSGADMALPLMLGGKSMGGRLVAQALTQPQPTWLQQAVGGVVFGYPWCPAAVQKSAGDAMVRQLAARCGSWPFLQQPLLVLQGERDAFGSPARLRQHYADVRGDVTSSAMVQIQPVAGADHDFRRVRSVPGDVFVELAAQTQIFVQSILGGSRDA